MLLFALLAPAAGQGPLPAAPRAPLTFTGEVWAGQRFERPLGQGLVFQLLPTPDGWEISVVSPDHPERDFVWVATPPYRFDNPRYLGAVYGRTAEATIAWTPRRFAFVLSDADAMTGASAVRTLLWPYGHTSAEVERAGQILLRLPRAQGHLAILDAKIAPPPSGGEARIERLTFRVVIRWPIDPQEALRPDDARGNECPKATPPMRLVKTLYFDFDGDGEDEVVVLGMSCLAGTGGADVFAVLKRLESGAVVKLPLDDRGGVHGGRRFYANLRGKMDVDIEDSLLVQRFPVYRDGDPNCCPTGGHRKVFYRWDGKAFVVERVQDVP